MKVGAGSQPVLLSFIFEKRKVKSREAIGAGGGGEGDKAGGILPDEAPWCIGRIMTLGTAQPRVRVLAQPLPGCEDGTSRAPSLCHGFLH